MGARRDRFSLANAVAALVLVGLIGFVPSVEGLTTGSARPALTLRFLVLLAGVAVGVPVLVRLAWRGDRIARIGVAFAVWAAFSAAASRTPLAWTGEFNSGTGAVFAVGITAYWAVGRVLPPATRPVVGATVLVGALLNATVAVLQGIVDLGDIDLPLYEGRSTGLLGNPVFLGAVCTAAVAFVPRVARRFAPAGLVSATLLAAGVQMSGARSALLLLLPVSLWAARASGRIVGAMLLVAVALGTVAGVVLLEDGGSASAAVRVQTGGTGPRLEYWRIGLEASMDRPIAGHGPGRFRAATSPRRTLAIARSAQPDDLYNDAHHLPVEYLVTTGSVGLALLVTWLALVGRDTRRSPRPEAAVAAAVLLAVHLVEPLHLVLTPLMVLLAATAGTPAVATPSRPARAATAVLAAVALAVGARVLTGDLTYRSADVDFNLRRMQAASARLWPWPEPVDAEGRIHAYLARTQKRPSELGAALAAARRARHRDPTNPIRSITVAAALAQNGDHEGAAAEYARALELNPWSKLAALGRATELDRVGRTAEARGCRTATHLEHPDRVLEKARATCAGVSRRAERERP